MKRLRKTAVMLLACSVSLISCSDDDGDDAATPATNNNGGGGGGGSATVNKYNGSASYGDILSLEIDQTNSTYTANNLTNGATVSNSYTELDAALDIDGTLYDVFEGLYEIDESTGGKSYAIEIADRILAGNFPTGRAENDIFLSVTDEASIVGQENQMAGTYFYVSLEPNSQSNGENEWGQFTIEDDGDLYGFWCDQQAPQDTGYTLPIDSSDYASVYQTFYYQLGIHSNGKQLEFYDENDNLLTGVIGYVYLDGESTALMIDAGTGEGTIFAFKTDLDQLVNGETFNDYVGDYKYVDYYENFVLDKGAGNFSVDAGKTFDISLIGFDTDSSKYYVDVSVGNSMSWTGVPGVYFSADWDGNGSTLYHVFAGDFVMYFDYDAQGNFKGYGIGGDI
ncbi:MAG: hypothetical protein RIC95_12860 [Vicingaceae bacterium]